MLRICVVVTALVASSFALPHFDGQSGDRVRDLVSAAIDYVDATCKRTDPSSIPDIKWTSKESHLKGQIAANLNLTNTDKYGMYYLQTEILKTDPKALTARVQFKFPQITLAGEYNIDGNAFGHQVNGKGLFLVAAVDYTFTLANVSLFETETKALRIRSFGLDVEIGNFIFGANKLTVQKMAEQDYEKLVVKNLLQLWSSIKPAYSKAIETNNIEMLNKAIGQRTLEEVTQWLKDHKGMARAENFIVNMITMP